MTAPNPLSGPHLQSVAGRFAARHNDRDALGAPMNSHFARVHYNAELLRGRYATDLDVDDVAATAWLHDVVEDGFVTLDELRDAGIPDHVIIAVDLLTHREKQPLEHYLEPIRENRLALLVKMADLRDNTDPVRRRNVAAVDPDRAERLRRKYICYHEVLDDAFRRTFGDDAFAAVMQNR